MTCLGYCRLFAMLSPFLVMLGAPEATWERSWPLRGAPLTNRIVFVVDTSGSMRGEPLAVAQSEVLKILSFATDGTHARVIAFGDSPEAFSSCWFKLPDEDMVSRVDEWMTSHSGAGNTDIAGAINAALAVPDEDLTIVLITDGEPTGPSEQHLLAIARAQKTRKRPAVVHVIGVRETTNEAAVGFMIDVATQNQGGLVLWSRRPREVH